MVQHGVVVALRGEGQAVGHREGCGELVNWTIRELERLLRLLIGLHDDRVVEDTVPGHLRDLGPGQLNQGPSSKRRALGRELLQQGLMCGNRGKLVVVPPVGVAQAKAILQVFRSHLGQLLHRGDHPI